MASRIAVFPGQGSQARGMGAGLFEAFPQETAAADAVLGYSIQELCLENPEDRLNQTAFTQPAVYVVNALSYLQKQAAGAPTLDFLAGHSLGEYNALFAAGAFDFTTGLKLVQKRGALMAEVTGGAMAAVIDLSVEQIANVLRQAPYHTIDIANLNAPEQTVISGPQPAIEAVREPLQAAGARAIVPLKVSAAFHSRYMQATREFFAVFLESFDIADPKIPVIANIHARPYEPGEVKTNLIEQITQPVRWVESVRWLLGQPDPQFEEIGPGTVLADLIRRMQAAD